LVIAILFFNKKDNKEKTKTKRLYPIFTVIVLFLLGCTNIKNTGIKSVDKLMLINPDATNQNLAVRLNFTFTPSTIASHYL
jgi:hypothetical protein